MDQLQGQKLTQSPPAALFVLKPKARDPKPYLDVARAAVPVLLFLFAILNWVPWQPAVIANELDGSWGLALQWAFLHHLDVGHQFVFTFGPWGFIWQGALRETLNTTVVAWIGLTAAFAAALAVLGKVLIPRFWPRTVWVAAIVSLSSMSVELIQDVRLLTIVWLFLFAQIYTDNERNRRSATPLKIILAIAVALASLVKFSIAVLALPIVLIGFLHDASRRRFPLGAVTYGGALIAFWLLSHQHLSSLAPYFHHSLIIAGGYAQGEGISTPDEALRVGQFVIFCFCFFAIGVKSPAKMRKTTANSIESSWIFTMDRFLALAALSLSLIVIFKIGYIRHDEHEISASVAMAVLALMYLPILAGSVGTIKRRRLLPVLLVVTSVLLLNNACCVWLGRALPVQIAHLFAAEPSRLRSAAGWFAGESTVEAEFQELRSLNPAPDVPLASLAGGVDEFGFKQWRLITTGADYRPRPVMQLYLCYTSQISRLNADFLAGPMAPAHLLFDIAPSDEHYPAIEDSLSWPQVIRAYDVAGRFPGFLLLSRRAQRRSLTLTPLKEEEGTLGEMTPVPNSSGCIWATFSIQLTPLGRVLQTIYKNPALEMEVQTADGISRNFRLIPDMARAGFMLSPEIIDRSTFAKLCADPSGPLGSANRVTAVKIDSLASVPGYFRNFKVAFSTMSYAPTAMRR